MIHRASPDGIAGEQAMCRSLVDIRLTTISSVGNTPSTTTWRQGLAADWVTTMSRFPDRRRSRRRS